MASPVFINSSYYQRAWRMLTSQKGWGKTIILIILALIVPLVGVLGVMGYCFERARMIAWGMQNAPEKGTLGVGTCLRSGLRGFVVAFCWVFVPTFVLETISMVLNFLSLSFIAAMLTLPIAIIILCCSVVGLVAALHATIYQKISAGFAVKRIVMMARHGISGLAKIIVSQFVVGFFGNIFISLLAFFIGMPLAGLVLDINENLVDEINYLTSLSNSVVTSEQAVRLIVLLLQVLLPIIIVFWLAGIIYSAFLYPVHYMSIGLWMYQFDVQAWGGVSDEMPQPMKEQKPWSYGEVYGAYNTGQQPADVNQNNKAALPQMTTDMPQSGYTAPVISGQNVDQEHVQPRFCPQCGNPLVPGDKFCRNCGKAIAPQEYTND